MKIVFGDDRARAEREIKRSLGEGYEVIEGERLTPEEMASVFYGTSLFGEEKKILVKDLGENKSCFGLVTKYTDTPHRVIVWETKLDKRTTMYKELKKLGVEMVEFRKAEPAGKGEVFDIFETALRDGVRAVKMAEKIENGQDPYMFFGLVVTQAIKRYEQRGGEKEKRVLRELSKTDKLMKTTSTQPWLILKSFLLRVSSL